MWTSKNKNYNVEKELIIMEQIELVKILLKNININFGLEAVHVKGKSALT